MANLTRTVETLTKLDLSQLNRILTKMQLDVNQLQGRIGPTNLEDSLNIAGSLSIGDATLTGDLLASLGGFSSRPVAPFLYKTMSLVDNVATDILQVTHTASTQGSHGLILYHIDAVGSSFTTGVAETGLVTYSGMTVGGLIASGVSATAALSAASVTIAETTTFATVNGTDSYTVRITANPGGLGTPSVNLSFWVWPVGGEIVLA